jgi:hypothetical protein
MRERASDMTFYNIDGVAIAGARNSSAGRRPRALLSSMTRAPALLFRWLLPLSATFVDVDHLLLYAMMNDGTVLGAIASSLPYSLEIDCRLGKERGSGTGHRVVGSRYLVCQ